MTATDQSQASILPGPKLRQQLERALRDKGSDYVPRTRHKHPDGSAKYTNRLIRESSPYLLQHAHNPVSWFPWGEEAFELARRLKRPVFLSVGYSTCHWCHVMEEESFEDEEIARYINQHYVPIKVDREQRPDVDSVYMAAVQLLTGRGGWPMSVWLTPEREPFFGGTYFPARDGDRGARKGFLTLLRDLHAKYRDAPSDIAAASQNLVGQVRRYMASAEPPQAVGEPVLVLASQAAGARYDSENGGVRGAPKFPATFPIRHLLRQYRRSGERSHLEMAVTTLVKMARGGLYDHVAGGFHRYSTDPYWLVPHFEKMLYDNALLSLAYLEGYQASGDAQLLEVARESVDYVLREMTSPQGAFYSATDADSVTPSGEREEGYFFTWTPAELEQSLSAEQWRLVEMLYAVSAEGNFEGRNILHVPHGAAFVAQRLGLSEGAFSKQLDVIKERLRAVRAKRPAPLRDEKIQASWNGLMLAALARTAFVTGEERYRVAAERAADYLVGEMWRSPEPGAPRRLIHSVLNDAGGVSRDTRAFLDDYAFLALGLLDCFELSAEVRHLDRAIELMDELERYHRDQERGGYFLTGVDHEALLVREKPDSDGALPSGNSVVALTQLRLHALTTDDRWRARAEATLHAFGERLARAPLSMAEMLLAVDFHTDQVKEVAIVIPDGQNRETAAPLVQVLRRTFTPHVVVVIATESELMGPLASRVPWAAEKPAKQSRPTAYVCRRGACKLPTTEPEVFAEQL